MVARSLRNVVPVNDTRRRRFAPYIPEVSERRMAPAIDITVEEMARQLAEDPEFLEWAAAERRGELFAGRPR